MATNIDEISQILHQANKDFDNLSEQRMDDYDKLISRIILIEKVHKYGSTGLERKHKEIEGEIESFIKKEEL
jgi:septation ring formation regulator EzrA